MRKRGKIHGFFIGGRNFKKEFKRQVRFRINITLGFTIAFSWRQTIFDAVQPLVQKIVHTNGPLPSVPTSITIIVTAIILIYIKVHFLKY